MAVLTDALIGAACVTARVIGERVATGERSIFGATTPRESPLSGEWSGDLTPPTLAQRCGIEPYVQYVTEDGLPIDLDEVISELCDAFESAYRAAFPDLDATG